MKLSGHVSAHQVPRKQTMHLEILTLGLKDASPRFCNQYPQIPRCCSRQAPTIVATMPPLESLCISVSLRFSNLEWLDLTRVRVLTLMHTSGRRSLLSKHLFHRSNSPQGYALNLLRVCVLSRQNISWSGFSVHLINLMISVSENVPDPYGVKGPHLNLAPQQPRSLLPELRRRVFKWTSDKYICNIKKP